MTPLGSDCSIPYSGPATRETGCCSGRQAGSVSTSGRGDGGHSRSRAAQSARRGPAPGRRSAGAAPWDQRVRSSRPGRIGRHGAVRGARCPSSPGQSRSSLRASAWCTPLTARVRRASVPIGCNHILPARRGKIQHIFPDSPDLVVKFQPIDIVDVILRMVLCPRVAYQREITG